MEQGGERGRQCESWESGQLGSQGRTEANVNEMKNEGFFSSSLPEATHHVLLKVPRSGVNCMGLLPVWDNCQSSLPVGFSRIPNLIKCEASRKH